MIGTHGRSGLDHLIFGSTAERVVRSAPCPVLTIRLASTPLITTMTRDAADPAAPIASIVVVDDDTAILELVSFLLTRRGYQVITATDAQTALELIAARRPELVLMDYMLPDLDGLSALRTIREQFPATYVIMFSGQGSEEIVVELMKAGAAEYLLKPFNNRTLVERVDGVLRLREIELANRALQTERERLLLEIDNWNRESAETGPGEN